jgi:SHS2 domain-containing protein
MPFVFLDHTGDIGVQVTAPTLDGLFVESARALTEILADASAASPQLADGIVVEGEDLPELLRNWLSELLFRFSANGMIYVDFVVTSASERRLEAVARGERYNPDRHPLRTELKAVTWHQLEAGPAPDGWLAQVIFDV